MSAKVGNLTLASAFRPWTWGIGGDVPCEEYDARHWLDCAEVARRLAEEMTHPPAKREMLLIAARYELLAQHAEERTRRLQLFS